MPGTLNYPAAAKWLGVSQRTLKRLVAEGAIRPAYIYRRVLFTEPMLAEFLEKCTEPLIVKKRRQSSAQVRQVQ